VRLQRGLNKKALREATLPSGVSSRSKIIYHTPDPKSVHESINYRGLHDVGSGAARVHHVHDQKAIIRNEKNVLEGIRSGVSNQKVVKSPKSYRSDDSIFRRSFQTHKPIPEKEHAEFRQAEIRRWYNGKIAKK
jgi:hypothetical protein